MSKFIKHLDDTILVDISWSLVRVNQYHIIWQKKKNL
jgi:hypothetical protein